LILGHIVKISPSADFSEEAKDGWISRKPRDGPMKRSLKRITPESEFIGEINANCNPRDLFGDVGSR
jgi:hypothetical protein